MSKTPTFAETATDSSAMQALVTHILDRFSVLSWLSRRRATRRRNRGSSAAETLEPRALLAGVYESTVLADSPTAFWRLGEPNAATTIADTSGNNISGTRVGGTFGQAGALADDPDTSLYVFNGPGAQIADRDLLTPGASATFEAWIKPDTVSAVHFDQRVIIGKGFSAQFPEYMLFISVQGNLGFGVSHTGGQSFASSTTTVVAGQWQHVAATVSNGTVRLYWNGTVVGTGSSGSFQNTPGSVSIGHMPGSSARGAVFAGQIDEVAFYRTALLPHRLLAHYHAGTNFIPTNIALSSQSVSENLPAGTAVGNLSTSDTVGNTHTYSLVSGAGDSDNASFEIVGNQLRTKSAFDFEAKSSYTVRVRTTDQGQLSFDKQFTISVTDVNEAPTAVSLENVVSVLPENTNSPIRVADILVNDDALGRSSISLTGTDAEFFEISRDQLFLKVGTNLNFEVKATYIITINVDDPTVGSTPDLTIPYSLTLTDVNEAPIAVSLQNVISSLPENTSTATPIKVADIVVTDDALGTNVLSLSGVDAARFELIDGQLFLRTGTNLDFESKASFDVTVNANDATVGGTPDAQVDFTLNVSNLTELSNLIVQNGLTQRSYVRYVDMIFDRPDELLNLINEGRFQVTKYNIFGNNVGTVSLNQSMFSIQGSTVRLDFGSQGVGGNRNANAGDGVYVIDIDLDDDNTFEAYAGQFHRLLGDLSGDGQVNAADKNQLLARSGPLAENDVNGDGLLNLTDTSLLTRAFGRKLWWWFAT